MDTWEAAAAENVHVQASTALSPWLCAISAGLWSLDNLQDPQTQRILREADRRPDDYVLKPQREGGGNNLYGDQLQQRLRDPKGLAAYILMQRIRPPINRCPSCLSSRPAAAVRAKHASLLLFTLGSSAISSENVLQSSTPHEHDILHFTQTAQGLLMKSHGLQVNAA